MPACRLCGAELRDTFVDLGMSPLCEKYVSPDRLSEPDPVFPLHAWVCRNCLLVQLEQIVTPQELFDDYAYFSSYSDSWVAHARRFTDDAIRRFGLNRGSRIVEVASNDGYLLQHFAARGLDVLGIEPAANVAEAAKAKGIRTDVRYFGAKTAAEVCSRDGAADLIVANNVLAHVPDVHDFASGLRHLLAPNGVVTMEFPHVVRLIEQNQFDTIYHEHFSYFSLLTAERLLGAHRLRIFDVDEIPTHGGSLRVYAAHDDCDRHVDGGKVAALRRREAAGGYDRLDGYAGFKERVERVRVQLIEFLQRAKTDGSRVAGYGAPGKGNTLLNYCGIGPDLLEYTVDRSPHKQGQYTPGTRIFIDRPDRIRTTRPDYVLVLPWNLKDEIMEQLSYIRDWGGRFVVAIPELWISNAA